MRYFSLFVFIFRSRFSPTPHEKLRPRGWVLGGSVFFVLWFDTGFSCFDAGFSQVGWLKARRIG